MQVAENDVHRLEVMLRLILGAEQKHDAVDRLMVQRGKVDSRSAATDCTGHLFHFGMFDVGDGHTLAKTGAAVLLALDERAHHFVYRVDTQGTAF